MTAAPTPPAAPTPLGGFKLVMQRQFEQLAGPVLHLHTVRGMAGRDGIPRAFVRMWLADSSGELLPAPCPLPPAAVAR